MPAAPQAADSSRPTTAPARAAHPRAALRRAAGAASALVLVFALTGTAAWAETDPTTETSGTETTEPTPSESPSASPEPTPTVEPAPSPSPAPAPAPTATPTTNPLPSDAPDEDGEDSEDEGSDAESDEDSEDESPEGDDPTTQSGDPATDQAPTTGTPISFDPRTGDLTLQRYIPSALLESQLVLEEDSAPIVAEFDWTVVRGTLTVEFTDLSTCYGYPCDDLEWNFGDGKTSNDRYPTHDYARPGTYEVTLKAWFAPRFTDRVGPAAVQQDCGDVEYDSYCTVTHKVTVLGPPNASFTATPSSGPTPLTVTFNDTSTGDVDSRAWSFSGACSGAGGTSAESFTETFTSVGDCTVTLRVNAPPIPEPEETDSPRISAAAFDPDCNCSTASKTITIIPQPEDDDDDSDDGGDNDDSDDSDDDGDNLAGPFLPPNLPSATGSPSPEPTEPSPTTPTEPTGPTTPTQPVDAAPAAWITGPGAPGAGITLMILAAIIGSLGRVGGLSMAGRQAALVADRDENTVQRHVAASDEEGWGDRSFTWRFPGHKLIDAASVVIPDRFARFSPLLGRITEDGSEFRAMFGTLWLATPLAGIALGLAGSAAAGGRALPPSVWLLAAGAVLAAFDALSGALAVVVFVVAALVSDATGGPDFVHSLLVLLAIGFLWMAIPLIGSAIRPFRRLGDGSLRHRWDVTADGIIAALLCGWVAQKLVQAMDLFAGQKTGLPEHANTIALVVMGAVALRVAMENFSMSAYPRRLQQVEGEDPPPPLLLASILGAFVRTAVFGFIGFAFIGSCWQLWLGVGLFLIPQLIEHIREGFPNFGLVKRILPRGVVEIFILVVACTLAARFAMSQSADQFTGLRLAFLLIAIPPALIGTLAMLAEDDDADNKTTWPREFLGAIIVAVTTVLAAHGWDY